MAARRTATKYAVADAERILPPEGLHNARVIRFLEFGTQQTDWGDKFQVNVSYELVDESAVFNDEDGEQNFVMHRTYNKSLGSGSELGKAVRAILGKDYVNNAEEIEMDEILDQPCKIMVEYSEDEQYANIVKVFPWKKSDGKCTKAENEPVSCYLDENFDQSVFDTLPEWVQKVMAESDEGQELLEEGLMEWEDPGPKSKKGKKKPAKKKKDEDDEDEEDEKPKRRTRSKAKDDDDDEEEEETEEDEDDKPKRRGARRSKRDDSESDEDEPKSKSKRSSNRDESEEDEEDEKPKRRGKQAIHTARKKR